MPNQQESLQTLAEIRSLMERSSKFLSLSGLSGISAGVAALTGAIVAFMRLKTTAFGYDQFDGMSRDSLHEIIDFLFIDGLCVLLVALVLGVFFTVRKAKKMGQSVWNTTSQRLLFSLAIPLITGGIFCLLMVFKYHIFWIVFPATLIFYGLALLNGSKYTLRDVEYLGLCEIALGLLSLWFPGTNLLMWAIGFGVLHIIYGALMYFKYDKNNA
jgi:predicted lysophospholipase L1 biosynthesis ABC-type transport system permease subunit